MVYYFHYQEDSSRRTDRGINQPVEVWIETNSSFLRSNYVIDRYNIYPTQREYICPIILEEILPYSMTSLSLHPLQHCPLQPCDLYQ